MTDPMGASAAVDYLVPSRRRRDLLRLLMRRKGLSVRRLALGAGLTYSSAHREVNRLHKSGLVRLDRVGNSLLCTWNRQEAQARALERLFSQARPELDEEAAFGNLKRWGAPLVREARVLSEWPVEETLAWALPLARMHPEVATSWPVVLARNLKRVDLRRLESSARRIGEKPALGFLLDLTGVLLGNRRLRRSAGRLQDDRVRKMRDFFAGPRGERALRLAEENTPALARKWRFRMNLPLDSFKSFFKKFVTAR